MIKNVAIFASGEGTNAQTIIDYFKSSKDVKIALVVSNKSTANVLNRATNNNIPTLLIDKHSFFETNEVVDFLKKTNIDLIVLAGFLWMIPKNLIVAFPNKIVNIHPSLLPKFGGKGMYGMHVHEAVIAAKEKESGISIHFVNEQYDEGKIISQHKCDIQEYDCAEDLAKKIHELEYEHFPKTIENLLLVK
ncbi:MAG: phosphoribosylglycinamide formyltransferase [Bacteroidetes bacterium]|nr:phosphoribosylglycinamide formyltransferase [Bacteroidota bacterium]